MCKDEQPKEKFNITRLGLIVIGVICIGIAAWGIYDTYSDYRVSEETYNELEDEFVEVVTPQLFIPNKGHGNGSTQEEAPEVPWYQMISVDLEGLHKKYPHIVGWIFFENETISYPVVHSDDNNRYLRTTYDGKKATAGCIFIEATHSGDFTDTHTIVYGHNMRNLTMFGKLKYYRTEKGYYDTHQYFQIFSGDEILRYQIFAYQNVSIDSFVYTENFTSAQELANKLLANSMINTGMEIKDTDKIITLSTCTTEDDHRFVVSAVLVERYSLSDKKLVENK